MQKNTDSLKFHIKIEKGRALTEKFEYTLGFNGVRGIHLIRTSNFRINWDWIQTFANQFSYDYQAQGILVWILINNSNDLSCQSSQISCACRWILMICIGIRQIWQIWYVGDHKDQITIRILWLFLADGTWFDARCFWNWPKNADILHS